MFVMRKVVWLALAALCLFVGGMVATTHLSSADLASHPSARTLQQATSAVVSKSAQDKSGYSRAVVALIAHGWNASGYEDLTTIKGRKMSMELTLKGLLRTLSTQCSLHIYFVVGLEDEVRIRQFLDGALGPPSGTRVSYSFVELDEAQLSLWLAAIGHKPSHRTGAAGNIKFFYPLVFPREEKMLMLDTDVLIGRDVCQLWNEFESFSEVTLFGFVPQKPKVDPNADNEFNAGVALLHLERMRRANWITLAKDSIAHWHDRGMRPPCCAHGDQSVFHMIRYMRPEVLKLLPRWWNINKCHKYQHINRNPPGSFVGIVHLGCCKMCTRGKLWPRWVSLLDEIEAFDISAHHMGSAMKEIATVRCGTGQVVLEHQTCPVPTS